MIEILKCAVFIADAHEGQTRGNFYKFLSKIEKKEIFTPQLIFMGDMFDLLIDQISHTKKLNQKTVDIINRLSKDIEIIYLEGNHDFSIGNTFPHCKVFPIEKQPLKCNFANKTILLSHGDIYQDKGYQRYTKFIRNSTVLGILNVINILTLNSISKLIIYKQNSKKMCNKREVFHKIKRKSKIYDIENSRFDFICEGHYHQHIEHTLDNYKYRVFQSFACDNSYFQIDFQGEIVFKQIT
jgi:UDP-2,3-diacylglucosamine hydrolase